MLLGEGLILPGMGKRSTEEMLLSQVYEAEPTRWRHGVQAPQRAQAVRRAQKVRGEGPAGK